MSVVWSAPVFQPAPSVTVVSSTTVNVTWTAAEPRTQLRGVARNYSIYLSSIGDNVTSWRVKLLWIHWIIVYIH